MPFKNIPVSKLRAKLIRKGLFTQLPYHNNGVEPENRMFRTVLDYSLYDLINTDEILKNEVIEWLHPKGNDFKEVCALAGLNSEKTYNMFLFFLQYFTPEVLNQLYCHQRNHNGIIKFSPKLLYPVALKFLQQN